MLLVGRGIVTVKERRNGEFLLVYDGDLISRKEGGDREDNQESIFRYFFFLSKEQIGGKSAVNVLYFSAQ